MSHGMNKITIERNQRALLELVAQPGNDVCADCKARAPRWASHNLGIFICVNCASIHRKIGTHITKVKSVTLDSWTKEQVESMRQNGNIKSNAKYNPDEQKHPPPTNMFESERDSELELYIRAKYQYKKFIDKSSLVSAHLGPSQSAPASQLSRPQSTPLAASTSSAQRSPAQSSKPPAFATNRPSTAAATAAPSTSASTIPPQPIPARSFSQPLNSLARPPIHQQQPLVQQQQPQKPSDNPVWDDLISLQNPGQSSTLPLQIQASAPPQFQAQATGAPGLMPPTNPFGQMQMAASPSFSSSMGLGSMNTGVGVGVGGGSHNPFQPQQQAQHQSSLPAFPSGGSFGQGQGMMPASGPSSSPFRSGMFTGQQQVQSPGGMGGGMQPFQPQPPAAGPFGQSQFAGSPQQPFGSSPQPPFGSSPQPQPQPPFNSSPQPPFGASPQPPFTGSPQPGFTGSPVSQPQSQITSYGQQATGPPPFNPMSTNPFAGWQNQGQQGPGQGGWGGM